MVVQYCHCSADRVVKPCLKNLLVATIAMAAALSGPTTIVGAQTVHEEHQMSNESAIRASFDAWSNGSGSPYDLLADEAKWTIVGRSAVSRTYTSKEDFLANVIRPFGARMGGPFVPTIRELYTVGDEVIIYFDAEGPTKDGKTYANTYAWFLEMRGGRIVKATAFFDSVAFNDFWSRVSPE